MICQCPICGSELSAGADDSLTKDFICRAHLDEHMYIHRLSKKDNQVLKTKVRITDEDGRRLCLKISYDQNLSEVWEHGSEQVVSVDHTFEPDFSSIDKLKDKIKMYMLFS